MKKARSKSLFSVALAFVFMSLVASNFAEACDPRRGEICRQCIGDICVGDKVYNVSRDSRSATVVGVEQSGKFVLRFDDNNGVGGGWSRSDLAVSYGCYDDICVYQKVYNVTRDSRTATVVGIQSNGKFVLRFEDNFRVGAGWSRSDLALMDGCTYEHLCVGDKVYNVSRDSRLATVVGIQQNGKIVLRFEDTSGVGAGWDASDLAVPRGCYNGLCVGMDVYNTARNYRAATILAIQPNGKFVLRFNDNYGVGGGWDSSDLVCKQY